MLLRDIREMQKLEKARQQPNLCFIPFSVADTLASIQASRFPELPHSVKVYFVDRGSLACITHTETTAEIYAHQVLNHGETPREVISLMCTHLLLHIRIPPTEHDGVVNQYPPGFWEAERALCPERTAAWTWIWINLDSCLVRRRKQQRVDVRRRWKEVWSWPKSTVAECLQLVTRAGREAPSVESGW